AFNTGMFQAQKDYYNGLYPNEGYTAYSRSEMISNANERSGKNYQPGKSQTSQHRGVKSSLATNDANQVRYWEIASDGRPTSSSHYDANELTGDWSRDTMGADVLTFQDKDGRMVYKRVLL